MATIILASFTEEAKALKALQKIEELDSFGEITLYDYIMIRGNENDIYQVLKKDIDNKEWKTLSESAIRNILGGVIGPIGLAIGLFTRTEIGANVGIKWYDFDEDFLRNIHNKMETGTIAIVAEVDEDSSVLIGNYMESFNAVISTTDADIEYSIYLDDRIEDIEEMIENSRENLKNATKYEKEKIKEKITKLKSKRKMKIKKLESKTKSTVQDIKDDIYDLEAKLEDAWVN